MNRTCLCGWHPYCCCWSWRATINGYVPCIDSWPFGCHTMNIANFKDCQIEEEWGAWWIYCSFVFPHSFASQAHPDKPKLLSAYVLITVCDSYFNPWTFKDWGIWILWPQSLDSHIHLRTHRRKAAILLFSLQDCGLRSSCYPIAFRFCLGCRKYCQFLVRRMWSALPWTWPSQQPLRCNNKNFYRCFSLYMCERVSSSHKSISKVAYVSSRYRHNFSSDWLGTAETMCIIIENEREYVAGWYDMQWI